MWLDNPFIEVFLGCVSEMLSEAVRSLVMRQFYFLSLIAGLVLSGAGQPVEAQKIRKDALEKVKWNTAPREYQIIDDRPIIRDFREAPQDPGTVDIGAAAGGGGG